MVGGLEPEWGRENSWSPAVGRSWKPRVSRNLWNKFVRSSRAVYQPPLVSYGIETTVGTAILRSIETTVGTAILRSIELRMAGQKMRHTSDAFFNGIIYIWKFR